MSLKDYQAALPNLFGDPKTMQPASVDTTQPSHPEKAQPVFDKAVATAESKPPENAQIKGFVDIIEYHAENHAMEIMPTKQFLPSKGTITKKQQTYKDYAVVLRRTWMEKDNVPIQIRIELEIQSQALCQALKKIIVDSYEDTDLESFPIKLRSPFSELFFYRDEIKALKEDRNNSNAVRQGAEVLHDFIVKNGLMTSIIADHERYSKEGHVVGDILWTIYPPNRLVVLNVGKLQECWICRNVSCKQDEDRFSQWEVVGFRIGYDGASPGLTRQSFQLPVMGTQACKISDLPLVPIKNYQDWPLLQKTLHARATRLQKVLGNDLSSFAPQTYANVGWAREISSYFSSINPMVQADQLDGRVVVDYKSFLSEHARSAASLEDFRRKPKQTKSKARARGVLANAEREARLRSRHRRQLYPRPGSDTSESDSDSDSIEFDSEDNADIMESKTAEEIQEEPDDVPQPNLNNLAGLSEAIQDTFHMSGMDFDLLFPALVPAFGLKKKEWLWILSDELQDVAWNMVAFEFLQLEAATKHLVQALVKGHKANSTAFDDVVPGKGQGLVFLLHGKPGLGKTLTAESVADYLERPLYYISGGELSTEVSQLERRLDAIFRLTKRWDAVCLLDEADVLLCKRNSAEMHRNAIVAVFLRKIEYFQGVLFLTTNRKQDFDEAFKSRIHATISYGDLSDEAQSMIWKRLIAANNDVRVDDSWTPSAFSALGKLRFNGRTIKNILRTAVAYANADDEALGLRHVLAMVQTELKDVDDELSVATDSKDSAQKDQVKAALDDLQRMLSQQPTT